MNNTGVFWIVFIAFTVWCLNAKGRRPATGHFHGGNRRTRAVHEAGHYVAAKAVGGSVSSAWLTRHEGGVNARNLPNAKAQIVFQLAGRYAAGTGAGCAGDDASIRSALREYPRSQRAGVMAAAEREARRIVAARRGEIQRVARKLDERGQL